jgi:maleamate amidohydrolase
MNKPALFIIDMINDSFTNELLVKQRTQLCSNICDLIAYARKEMFHIIWVRQKFEPDLSDAFLEMKEEQIEMYIKGTPGSAIVDELVMQDGDFEIIKKRYSMYFNTGLDKLIGQIDPSKLILAGVNTHACIRMAAIDAYQRDYRTIIVKDAIASQDKRHHDVSLEYLGHRVSNVVSLDELKRDMF